MNQENPEFIRRKILANGLTILIHEMPQANSVTVRTVIRTGYSHGPKEAAGTAHFLEHMIFEGSKKYPSRKDIDQTVQKFGGDFNAFTSNEQTIYTVKIPSESKGFAFGFFREVLFHPLILPEAVEREREIIMREIDEGIDKSTENYLLGVILQKHLLGKDHPLTWGYQEYREPNGRISPTDLSDWHRRFYTPSNIILIIAGNISAEEGLGLAEKHFGDLPYSSEPPSTVPPVRLSRKRDVRIIRKPHGKSTTIAIGFLTGILYHHPDCPALEILNNLIKRQVFDKFVYGLGISYSARTHPIEISTNYSQLTVCVQVGTKRTEQAVAALINQINELKITPETLQAAKNTTKAEWFLDMADSDDYVDFIEIQDLYSGIVKSPQQIKAEIDAVSIEDVLRLKRKWLTPEYAAMVVRGRIPSSLKKKINAMFRF